MRDLLIGIGIGSGLAVIIEIIYYIKYLNVEKKFKEKLESIESNVKKYIDEHEK